MSIRISALALSALLFTACATTSSSGPAAAPQRDDAGETFDQFQQRIEAAAVAMMNGDTRLWEALYSHAPDATLFGGWGGPGEKGWAELSKRWQMVTGRYERATLQIEPVSQHLSGDLAVTVQLWRGEASFSDGSAGPIALRVTHVCRRENGEWRIVHRHADEQMKLLPIKSHIQPPEPPAPSP